MISLSYQLLHEITEYLKRAMPEEGCGYLAGQGKVITAFYPIENRLHSSRSFAFEEKAQFEAVRLIRSQKLSLIGVVHSHPGGIAYPSNEDCVHADAELFQLIVVPDSVPVQYRLFHIAGSEVHEIDLNVH